jgi:hypothetical protein
VTAIDRTVSPLKDCETTFMPLSAQGKGEEVRAYGNSRAKSIQKELEKYHQAVLNAARSLDLDIRVLTNAGKGPV